MRLQTSKYQHRDLGSINIWEEVSVEPRLLLSTGSIPYFRCTVVPLLLEKSRFLCRWGNRSGARKYNAHKILSSWRKVFIFTSSCYVYILSFSTFCFVPNEHMFIPPLQLHIQVYPCLISLTPVASPPLAHSFSISPLPLTSNVQAVRGTGTPQAPSVKKAYSPTRPPPTDPPAHLIQLQ